MSDKKPTPKPTPTPKPNIPPTSFSGRTVLGEVYLPKISNIPSAPKPTTNVINNGYSGNIETKNTK